MKFCQTHWDALRNAIDARGLSHLVAKNGEEAHARMVSELEGTEDAKNYDPLMSAHWMITHRALEMGGLYLLAGEYCPLCEVVQHLEAGEDAKWITGCCDAILEHCRALGLLGTPQ